MHFPRASSQVVGPLVRALFTAHEGQSPGSPCREPVTAPPDGTRPRRAAEAAGEDEDEDEDEGEDEGEGEVSPSRQRMRWTVKCVSVLLTLTAWI